MEARFWTWEHGPTRIKIKVNQTLSHYQWERTDEGWHSSFTEWFFDGEYLYRQWERDGRDCDGRRREGGKDRLNLRHYNEGDAVSCREENDRGPNDITYPLWEMMETDPVYDEYAQAAGY